LDSSLYGVIVKAKCDPQGAAGENPCPEIGVQMEIDIYAQVEGIQLSSVDVLNQSGANRDESRFHAGAHGRSLPNSHIDTASGLLVSNNRGRIRSFLSM